MTTLVDTSALYDLLDTEASRHVEAAGVFRGMLERDDSLVTHNYVIVETTALVQRRLGIDATRALMGDVLPVIDVHWVDDGTHRAAVAALLAARHRSVSLVDWVSFELMRALRIDRAFAFDADFRRQGFATVP